MKTLQQKPATSKLIARFDQELKNILMEDLKAFREKNRFVYGNNNQSVKAAWSTYIFSSTYKDQEFHRELFFFLYRGVPI